MHVAGVTGNVDVPGLSAGHTVHGLVIDPAEQNFETTMRVPSRRILVLVCLPEGVIDVRKSCLVLIEV